MYSEESDDVEADKYESTTPWRQTTPAHSRHQNLHTVPASPRREQRRAESAPRQLCDVTVDHGGQEGIERRGNVHHPTQVMSAFDVLNTLGDMLRYIDGQQFAFLISVRIRGIMDVSAIKPTRTVDLLGLSLIRMWKSVSAFPTLRRAFTVNIRNLRAV